MNTFGTRRIALASLLPIITAVIFTVLVQAYYATPVLSVLWYLIAFAFVVTGPGTLVYRSLLGSRGSWLSDLALGSATGLLLQLVFWAVSVTANKGFLMLVCAALVYAVFALVPPLRRHFMCSGESVDVPLPVAWALSGVYCLALVVYSGSFATAMPPAENQWYQDEYWHLGNASWLLHHLTPTDMRVAGEGLTYHWFSSAHVAAQTLATGLDLNLVAGRLWTVPFYACSVVLMAVVLRQLVKSWWPGVVAALMMVTTAELKLTWLGFPDGGSLTVHSPSQTYSVVAMLLIFSMLITLLVHGRLPGGGWVLLVITFFAAPGAKSSLLPVVVCGLLLASLVAVLRRKGIGAIVVAAVMSVVAMAASFRFLGAGGGDEIKLQLFSTVRHIEFYVEQVGLTSDEKQFARGFLIPGQLTLVGIVTLIIIVALYCARYSWLLAAAPTLRRGPKLPAAAFLLGTTIAGFAAAMLINHDGMSQLYFLRGGLVAAYLVAAWGAWETWQLCRPERALRIGVAGSISGAAFITLWFAVAGEVPIFKDHPAISAVICAAVVLVPIGISQVMSRALEAPTRSAVQLFMACALIAASVVPGASHATLAEVPTGDPWAVTADESAAALWMRDNTSQEDIIATNVHCSGQQSAQCGDTRSFWVSGLTQRQVLIEGWAYTPTMRAAHGVDGRWYGAQPFKDTALHTLNQEAFTAPTAEGLRELAGRGVRWLYADKHRGEVSSQLASLATVAFDNQDVTIYKLTVG